MVNCSRFFTKILFGINFWRDIFTSMGCNNISIFDYPSCTKKFVFISNEWCYDLFVWFFDNCIYMKIYEEFNLSNKTNSKEVYSVKLNKSFYLLKQLGCMWYNHFGEYLLKKWYKNDLICLKEGIKSIVYKWIFVIKNKIKNGEIILYKALLIVQDFS